MQRPLDAFGIARDDSEVSSSRLIRLRAALFPIPQSAKGDVVARGKIFLRQRESAAEGLYERHATQLPDARIREGWIFKVAGSGSFDFRSTPPSKRWSVERFFGAVRFDPDKPAVTARSRDSRGLAHILSLGIDHCQYLIASHSEQDDSFFSVVFAQVNPLDGERVTECQCCLGKAHTVIANILSGLGIVPLEVQISYYGDSVVLSTPLRNR